jgi:MoaA/NifB/PqqE/SkfB family radical SAM enzyme
VGYSNLPADEGLTFFEEPGSLGVMDVFLTGDEPFTRPGLPSLVQGLVRNRLRFGLASNGTSIDDAVAAGIASTGRCNHVQVSVDGSCPETHDAARGAGSFDGAIRATGSRSRRVPRSIATPSTTWRTPLACCWRTWG